MKYGKTIVPFVGNREIKQKADTFRKKVWGDAIPIEIEEIVELKMRIRIIPVPGFMKQCGVDAQISSDFASIYVDQDSYENERFKSRFRFSLAHELGHFVLHKNFYGGLKIDSLEDILAFISEINTREYSHFETQANKFANYFLVPREKLLQIRENILKEIGKKHNLEKVDEKTLNSYLAGYIAPDFLVSLGTLEIALNDLTNSGQ